MFALREEATLTGRRLSLESLQGSQIPLFKILAEISLSLSLFLEGVFAPLCVETFGFVATLRLYHRDIGRQQVAARRRCLFQYDNSLRYGSRV